MEGGPPVVLLSPGLVPHIRGPRKTSKEHVNSVGWEINCGRKWSSVHLRGGKSGDVGHIGYMGHVGHVGHMGQGVSSADELK